MNELYHEIIIIGAGASGIIASIASSDRGKDVALLEGNDRIGRKILITGNGRCNISNKNIDCCRYHGNNHAFTDTILNQFSVKDTVDFFSSLGLPIVTLQEGKMFPMSLQASSVLDILRSAVEDRNIQLYLNFKVKEVKREKNLFTISTTNGTNFQCKKLILATGGKSAPSTGSDGSGYNIAKSLGHNIISPIPALVQLKLNYNHLSALAGIKFMGTAEIFVKGNSIRKEYGEILFTEYGISGPPILQLSRIASKAIFQKSRTTLKIDMFPDKDKTMLKDFLENHWCIFNYRSISNSFIGIINKKIIPILLKDCGINDKHKPCFELDWKEKSNIIEHLKEWEFEISCTNSFSNSQVTAGGIDTSQIDSITLESKLVPNLYFSGEVLDVDGDCGGFNLQWAWSSGYVAGKNASL